MRHSSHRSTDSLQVSDRSRPSSLEIDRVPVGKIVRSATTLDAPSAKGEKLPHRLRRSAASDGDGGEYWHLADQQ